MEGINNWIMKLFNFTSIKGQAGQKPIRPFNELMHKWVQQNGTISTINDEKKKKVIDLEYIF